ncbi:MAG: hypothetical protein DHS20C16_34500 [Phycisphaerae bacterium]|nr:MAG: hypothetical protein DHS20C16_34500 [Phycisphaerae bacterium]
MATSSEQSNPIAAANSDAPASSRSGWLAWSIGPIFFALAAWFAFGPDLLDVPIKETRAINADALTTEPRRIILHDPPTINIGGFDRTCMDCHKMFPPRDDPPKALAQHQNVVLNHGINKQCRNCHDTKDRNRLVLRGGETIGFNDVVTLCSKCHGVAFRDWERGAHGRTNGYWDASRGEVRRLQCTECHNPHNPRVPAMDPIVPLPGPNTLRMRSTEAEHAEGGNGHEEIRDPLRRAIHQFTTQEQHGEDSRHQPSEPEEYVEPDEEGGE